MNERIDEIIAKSKLKNLDGFAQYEIDAIHNLAELIVKECAEIFPMTFTDEQYQRRIDKTILKHFGLYE